MPIRLDAEQYLEPRNRTVSVKPRRSGGTKAVRGKRIPRTSEERKIYRNNYRKQAEKTRRETMKASFQGIKEVLPSNCVCESKPRGEHILDAARNYISELEESERVKLERVDEMEKEIKLCKLLLGL
ncbi:hypothetical protein HDU98_004243 [Podochytrium sp. JEL0797]|nr:hypothetical protein HDU98_004243 [Podochytrium sp. JEL0797]